MVPISSKLKLCCSKCVRHCFLKWKLTKGTFAFSVSGWSWLLCVNWVSVPCLPFFYHLPLLEELKSFAVFFGSTLCKWFGIRDYHLLLDAQSHQSSSVNQCASSSSSYFPLLIRLGWEKTELQFGERSWRYRFLPVFSFTMLLLSLQLTLATLFTLFFHSFDYVCLLCVLPVCALCGIVCYLGNSRCTLLLID